MNRILHEDLKVVSFVDFYQRARLLAIDEIRFSGKAVYKALAISHLQRERDRCLKTQIVRIYQELSCHFEE